ncbi:(2Fe-2S)-binding protein [Salinarimonas sp. NSM]|uniref:(2Fe-2S)-binding protein n=1 Tax=Salinarimonas sp. NSM TaxID=3458003 RepID=UPI004035BF29
MIVCSCNVLSDQQVKACMNGGAGGPRTPAQVYRCLGCAPRCGRCATTIRKIMNASFAEASADAVEGCTETCGAACLHHAKVA